MSFLSFCLPATVVDAVGVGEAQLHGEVRLQPLHVIGDLDEHPVTVGDGFVAFAEGDAAVVVPDRFGQTVIRGRLAYLGHSGAQFVALADGEGDA